MFPANERGIVGGEENRGRRREAREKAQGIGVVVEEQAREANRHKQEEPADEYHGFWNHDGGGGVNSECTERRRRETPPVRMHQRRWFGIGACYRWQVAEDN